MFDRLPWFLLAISIALNVFVLAGQFRGAFGLAEAESPEPRVMMVSEQLALSPEQVDQFEVFSRDIGERWRMFRDYMEPVRFAMADELAKPEFDRESYLRVLRMRQEVREEYFLQFGEELHAYIQTLRPDQRARFVELARERGFLRRVMGNRPRPGGGSGRRGDTAGGAPRP